MTAQEIRELDTEALLAKVEEYKKERLRPRIKIEKRFSKEEWLLKAQEIEEKAKRGGF